MGEYFEYENKYYEKCLFNSILERMKSWNESEKETNNNFKKKNNELLIYLFSIYKFCLII